MLRINELKLPLNHTEAELSNAIINKLAVKAEALKDFSVFKRSYDARKKDNIQLIYPARTGTLAYVER